jgi:hypothetical protein
MKKMKRCNLKSKIKGQVAEFEVWLPDCLEEAQEIYGKDVVYKMIEKQLVAQAQTSARFLMINGTQPEFVKERMEKWNPIRRLPQVPRSLKNIGM